MTWTINMSNFTSSPFTYALSPYVGIFGQFFFAFLLLVPAVYIYLQTDRNTWISAVYLLGVGAFFLFIVPSIIISLILILAGFVITGLLISRLAEKRGK